MPSPFISFLITIAIITLDFVLRGDLIRDNLFDYIYICILLFGSIYFIRFTLSLITNKIISVFIAITAIVLFSFIYWIQSAVYSIYFQFITAADLGIVFGNLTYWQEDSDKVISLINLPWLATYIVVFSFAFLFRTALFKSNKKGFSKLIQIQLIVIGLISISALYAIKKQQLHFLSTPMLSLGHEIRRLYYERDRFIKQYDSKSKEGYYVRNVDPIAPFEKRDDFNVLLIILESLRYDHMSLYGYERDTTPFQKNKFKNAFHFHNTVSNATSTDTSTEVIFTGLERTDPEILSTSLIWSYLKSADLNLFYTGSHWLEWNGWFGRSFLSEQVDSIQAPLAVDASLTGYDMTTARKFKKTLSEFSVKENPFFGVVHFAGTHYPYVATEKFNKWQPASVGFDAKKVNELINQYDNSIAYNDAAVEIVVNELRELNLHDNTIIIVTADHGEAMYEHKQFFHGKVFWQEGIHVPMYIDIPEKLFSSFTNEEITNLTDNQTFFTSIVDIFPTILDLYSIPQAKDFSGYSLLKPYPKSLIKIYMIPEEYAVIDSHSGEKYHVDNTKKELRYTKLREDPNEKNSHKIRLKKNISISELIEMDKSKVLKKHFGLNQ